MKIFFYNILMAFFMFFVTVANAEDLTAKSEKDSQPHDMGCFKQKNLDAYKLHKIYYSYVKKFAHSLDNPVNGMVYVYSDMGLLINVDNVYYLYPYNLSEVPGPWEGSRELVKLYAPNHDLSQYAPDDIVRIEGKENGESLLVTKASCAIAGDIELYRRNLRNYEKYKIRRGLK